MDRYDYSDAGFIVMSHNDVAATGAVNIPALFSTGTYKPIASHLGQLRHSM